jgi:branched-chain amino acid transport system ATP-binding protein
VIDKNLSALLDLCDHHHIIEKGRVVWHGDSAALREDAKLREQYLSA